MPDNHIIVDSYNRNELVELEMWIQEAHNARNDGKINPYTARVEVDEETGLTRLEKELAVLERSV